MQVSSRLRIGILAAGATLAASLVLAQDKPAESPGQPPALTPEQQAMMQKWQAFSTPGDPHKMLAEKEGSWTNKVTMWMEKGAQPETSEGTTDLKMTLDGRFLEDTTHGSFQGMPFEGRGVVGYDNMKKKYVSTWIDNMGTGIMTAEGTYDPKTKSFTYRATSPDVMTGKYKPARLVEKMQDPDHWTMEMLYQTPDGKGWWKTMEIEYTRRK